MKDIPGYEGFYAANEDGEIFSLTRTILKRSGKVSKIKGRKLKQRLAWGYPAVVLSKNYLQKNCHTHRIMALTFLRNPNNLKQVNHKDGNKLNNQLNNLEWISHGDNIRHYIKSGRKPSNRWLLLLCLRTGIYYESKAQAEKSRGVFLHVDYLDQHDFINCGKTVY